MLFTLTPEEHDEETIINKLSAHPEVRFVSFTGVDMGGHNTDEKIPVAEFCSKIESMLRDGAVNYYTVWKTDDMIVYLLIQPSETKYSGAYLRLEYISKLYYQYLERLDSAEYSVF